MTENTDTTAGPAYAPAPSPAPRPPLRRSRTDRVIGGVGGGIASWLGIDPVIVRVVLVVLAIFGGSGLLLYAAGWLFIPDEGATTSEAERFIAKGQRPGSTTRTVLIVIAAIIIAAAAINLLAAGPFNVWGLGGGSSILLLLAVGGLVLYLVNRHTEPPTAGEPAPPVPSPTVTDATPVEPDRSESAATMALAPTAARPEATTTGFAYGGYGDYPGYTAPVPTPVAPKPAKQRSYLGLATLSLALVTMGTMGALSMGGVVQFSLVVILAAGLGVLGLGLLVGTLFGRARWLMALAIPLLLVIAPLALIPQDLHLPRSNITIGDYTWTPTTAQSAATPRSLWVGDAMLDLTGLQLPPGEGTYPVSARVGIGQLSVKVPAGMRVHVTATTSQGKVAVEGLPSASGSDAKVVGDLPGTVSPTAPTVELRVQVGLGDLEVSRA